MVISFEITSDRRRTFDVHRSLEVGLGDVIVDVYTKPLPDGQLLIEQFDPSQDRLDLLGFWAEGHQAQLMDLGSAGTRVDLPFNQQSITLSGVNINQLSGGQLLIWGA